MRIKYFGFLLIFLALSAGCKTNGPERVACDGSSPTWNGQVLDIIANSCWSSSCHGTGASSGDYTTYAGIKPDLLNGKFEQQVLESRNMPRGEVFPDSTLAKLQCWLANGFPES